MLMELHCMQTQSLGHASHKILKFQEHICSSQINQGTN